MTKINNIVRHNTVESDLVYPLDKGYYYICQVDPTWMKKQLRMVFGRSVEDINNKYAISLRGQLYCNHDGIYWLISNS